MSKRPADIPSFQRSFQDVRALLMRAASSIATTGGAASANILGDMSRLTQSLVNLEQAVIDQLKIRETQIGALTGIGQAINSSLGLNRVLEEVMYTLIELMRAERGFLMLQDSEGRLSIETASGIGQMNLDGDAFQVSQQVAERVAVTGEAILTTNAQADPRFENEASVAAYQLRSILCAPLKNKNQVIGVIYVDNRARSGIFQEQDLNLIKAFANQAAVAIDNARLFDDLQKTNRELQLRRDELAEAYQRTLEGWVHALDLKDKETEGHTRRVTSLTERLARSMGVEGEALEHVRRGALLHDIGKMGIPDSILTGKDKLTPEERELMQQHPIYARDMLSPIKFLRPAIDIPYCHHEKWDGTGYPRGLRGDEIPFAARIFMIVDVWDALVSDRSYRKALPRDEVRLLIKEDSGKHFDPNVVKEFLELEDLSVS